MLCEASIKKSERTLAFQLFISLGRWRPLRVSEPFALIAETINIDQNQISDFRSGSRISQREGAPTQYIYLISKNPMNFKTFGRALVPGETLPPCQVGTIQELQRTEIFFAT